MYFNPFISQPNYQEVRKEEFQLANMIVKFENTEKSEYCESLQLLYDRLFVFQPLWTPCPSIIPYSPTDPFVVYRTS